MLHAAEQDRPDVATWRLSQLGLPAKRLVFIDETGASTKMTRQRGRAPCGKRLIAKVPHGHWQTTTFVAGLRSDGISAPLVVDGPMNGELFLAYVEQQLVPTSQSGDLVVMDNLPNSNGSCEAPPNEPSKAFAKPSPTPSNSSHPTNAETIFGMPATLQGCEKCSSYWMLDRRRKYTPSPASSI